MTEPWNKPNRPIVWFNSNLERSNRYCLYCGTYVGPGAFVKSNKEHLIGRDFVPRGSFQTGTSFNFIFRTCASCNAHKSMLEAHVSSITIFNSPDRLTDKELDEIARRKGAHTYHPDLKATLVKDSTIDQNFSFPFGDGRELSFKFVGPPQLNREFVEQLAFYHIKAFYTLTTIRKGGSFADKDYYRILDPEYFHVIGQYIPTDWGNLTLRSFGDIVKDWRTLALIVTANQNFKLVIRINAGEPPGRIWGWALEWNRYLRIIGAIGSIACAQHAFNSLKAEPNRAYTTKDGEIVRIHEDRALLPAEDILFKPTTPL